jgi:hypothetical protein
MSDVSLELFLLAHISRQGALVTIRLLWAETTEPPQSAVTMLLFPPFTSAVLLLIART